MRKIKRKHYAKFKVVKYYDRPVLSHLTMLFSHLTMRVYLKPFVNRG
jgi:hypothetical protein